MQEQLDVELNIVQGALASQSDYFKKVEEDKEAKRLKMEEVKLEKLKETQPLIVANKEEILSYLGLPTATVITPGNEDLLDLEDNYYDPTHPSFSMRA